MSLSLTCECGRHFESPEANAGRLVRCPDCGRESIVPKPTPPPDLEFVASGSKPSVTSGKAIASLALSAVVFLACLSGLAAVVLGGRAVSDIQLGGGRVKGRGMPVARIVLSVIGCLWMVALVLPLYRSAGDPARPAQCTNNLKQIGLAFHTYHEANGCLPPAAITDRNGRPLLSWRVAILPYLEASPLYSKFHLDEPWDRPHNLSLLELMPLVYGCPRDRARKPGMTGYQVVIDPATAFTPDFKPLPFRDFTDGLSDTLIVGESRRDVPWTKPEDLPVNGNVRLTGLGSHHSYHNNGFNALFGDGSVRFLKDSITPSVLHALLTRNAGDDVSPGSY